MRLAPWGVSGEPMHSLSRGEQPSVTADSAGSLPVGIPGDEDPVKSWPFWGFRGTPWPIHGGPPIAQIAEMDTLQSNATSLLG